MRNILLLAILGICGYTWWLNSHRNKEEVFEETHPHEFLPVAPSEPETSSVAVIQPPIVKSSVTEPISTEVPKKVWVRPSIPSQEHWTWNTTDGKTYNEVKVVKIEADAVTILHSEGGGLITMDRLPDDLQKQFNYDADLAQEAAHARLQMESQDAQALSKERQMEEEKKQAMLAATVQATSVSSQPQAGYSPAQIASMRARIDYLRQDIAFMQAQENKVDGKRLITDGREVTHGVYPERIAAEQAEMSDLESHVSQSH
jgi:hypothetical protein